MTENIIAAIIGATISLITTMLTLLVTAIIEKSKVNAERQQRKEEAKREKLTNIYTELISIINSYPNVSPNNVLSYVEYSPHYSMESFGVVINSLNYQIDDYKHQLENKDVSGEVIIHNESQIRNREYAIEQILSIKKDYFNAREAYKEFCNTKKSVMDMYAGQIVKNKIVEFEVLIHNVFISGYTFDDVDDPRYNTIDIKRQEIINSIRNDIGIN